MNWYYSIEGRVNGPVDEQYLGILANDGVVNTATLIWHPGLDEWQPVSTLKPEIIEGPNKPATASSAIKGATDHIPGVAETKPAGGSPGFLRRFFGRFGEKK